MKINLQFSCKMIRFVSQAWFALFTLWWIIQGYELMLNCETNNFLRYPFYKIKKCHRSNGLVIARANFRTATECMNLAKERNGFAINYSPPGVSKHSINCQVIGCPETSNFTFLSNDTTFDYYSLFGNVTTIDNSSCLKTEGLFRLVKEKANYTTAISICQKLGGDLANVVSETRTNFLSSLVNEEIEEWYKAAYVGLDDRENEGYFETSFGNPLNCFKFRAWGPGQPRKKHDHDDCVIIDNERTWRVVRCKIELPFICELFPQPPFKNKTVATKKSSSNLCYQIRNADKRQKCIADSKKNLTETDRCSLEAP